MDLKIPLSFDDQIEKLKEHGMTIKSESEALSFLKQVNYYRFTGYALENRKGIHKSEYDPCISFNLVKKRYLFDVKLRHILREYIEYLEVYYRTQISNVFSLRKCIISPYNQHYDRNNYYLKEKFDELIQQIHQEEKYYKDSLIVIHHKKNYGNQMPLWVLVELMSFSSLSKYYRCLYYSEQNAIAKTVKGSPRILTNNLHCLAVLRNKCAHAARLYGCEMNPPVQFGRNFLKKHPEIINNTLFAYIIMLIRNLSNPTYRKKTN